MSEKKMPILKHLDELRRVLIISLVSIIPASGIAWFFREDLLKILTRPVDNLNYKLVYISPTEAFIANIKIAVIGGIILASPIITWQIWSFILPALTKQEKKYVFIVMPISVFLFVTGVVFGYFTVFNFGVAFLLGFGGEGLEPMLSLNKYLSFAFWFLLPFGIIFELPLVILFLTRIGLVTPTFLARNRKFALLVIFIISALVTPTTDMVSQLAMAGPMYLLYEISIWISRVMKVRARPAVEIDREEEESPKAGAEEPAIEETEKTEVMEKAQEAEDSLDIVDSEDKRNKRLEEVYKKITDKGNNKE